MTKIDQAEAHASAFFIATDRDDPPLFDHTVQPIKSLPNVGFVWIIGISAVGFTLPLLALLGTLALWMLLPHLLLALGLLWYFIRRNDRDRDIFEHIRIWPDLIAVHRHNPRKADQYWHGNPYWVRLKLRDRFRKYRVYHTGRTLKRLTASLIKLHAEIFETILAKEIDTFYDQE
ncbi:MAG: DUF2244 domain-containing protein [Kordiimonadaceae bacterium]|nr:DUF2244 domain-containing protein [Kordiimonadaceae bacterium]